MIALLIQQISQFPNLLRTTIMVPIIFSVKLIAQDSLPGSRICIENFYDDNGGLECLEQVIPIVRQIRLTSKLREVLACVDFSEPEEGGQRELLEELSLSRFCLETLSLDQMGIRHWSFSFTSLHLTELYVHLPIEPGEVIELLEMPAGLPSIKLKKLSFQLEGVKLPWEPFTNWIGNELEFFMIQQENKLPPIQIVQILLNSRQTLETINLDHLNRFDWALEGL